MNSQNYNKTKLEALAYKCREHIIRMSTDGGCFIGASLSCIDTLVYLYSHFLNVNKDNLDSDDRDLFILSKGHDVPALYSLFCEIGILEVGRLKNHLTTRDDIYWHPNRNIPGVEFHSGSLGHGLSIGIGFAMSLKIDNKSNNVVVMLGDGELNEGSVWEAFLVARAHKLGNLIAVVDRNKYQANMLTEELIPLEPLTDRLDTFGWETFRCDGHDFDHLHKTFSAIQEGDKEQPKFVVVDTIRGKGLPSIESQSTRWFVNFSHEEVEGLLHELKTGEITELKSEEIIAR